MNITLNNLSWHEVFKALVANNNRETFLLLYGQVNPEACDCIDVRNLWNAQRELYVRTHPAERSTRNTQMNYSEPE